MVQTSVESDSWGEMLRPGQQWREVVTAGTGTRTERGQTQKSMVREFNHQLQFGTWQLGGRYGEGAGLRWCGHRCIHAAEANLRGPRPAPGAAALLRLPPQWTPGQPHFVGGDHIAQPCPLKGNWHRTAAGGEGGDVRGSWDSRRDQRRRELLRA